MEARRLLSGFCSASPIPNARTQYFVRFPSPSSSSSSTASFARRKKLAVFVSGGGSNFRSIHDACLNGSILGDVVVLVATLMLEIDYKAVIASEGPQAETPSANLGILKQAYRTSLRALARKCICRRVKDGLDVHDLVEGVGSFPPNGSQIQQ